MRRHTVVYSAILLNVILAACSTALGQVNYGAVTSGNWNNGSTWTPSGTPGAADTVFIGSSFPAGAAGTATVSLVQDQSVSNVYLGYGSGTSGTLDLGSSVLTVGGSIYLGYSSGATAAITRTTGSFSTQDLYVLNGSSLTFGANDVVSNYLQVNNAATVTTVATGNLPNTAAVYGGSTLNLGAALNLSGSLDVRDTGSTIDMNGNSIAANTIYLGWYDGQATTLNRGTVPGTLTATNLYVGNQTLNLLPTDAVTNFYLTNATSTLNSGVSVSSLGLQNGSVATTTAAGNVTGGAQVWTGSTLNLGAALNLSGSLDVRDTGTTINMNGNSIAASTIYLGWYDGQATTLNRGTVPGTLTATNLYVGNQTLNLLPTDAVTNFYLTNATSTLNSSVSVSSLGLQNGSVATTTAAGNVTGGAQVWTGSTLNLGAALNLSGTLDVRDTGTTINMNGNSIAASSIYLGWYDGEATTLNRGTVPGTLTATNLYVGNQTLNLLPTDAVTNFNLTNANSTLNSTVSVSMLGLQNGSVATTTAAGNVTGGALVWTGSTLNLGAALNLSGSLDVRDTGTTINMNGNSIAASTIYLGWYDGEATTLNRGTVPGTLTAANLYVGNQTLNLLPTDAVTNFNLTNAVSTLNSNVSALNLQNNSSATTTATGSPNGGVQVLGGTLGPSTLTLGTDLNLSGNLDVRDNSIVNAQGHNITAGTIYLGNYDTSPVSLVNNGLVQATNLYLGNGTAITLHSGDVIGSLISLSGNSSLTVVQNTDQLTGLTLNGAYAGALLIDPSQMDLIFNSNTQPNWIFRWADPTSGNWISTLDALISDNLIDVTAPDGYSVVDSDGYTYIESQGGTSSIPEPTSLVIFGLLFGLFGFAAIRRRKKAAQMHPRISGNRD